MTTSDLAEQMLYLIEQMPRNAPQLVLSELSRGELFILNYLHRRQGPARPGEISAAMQTSTARTAAALGNMEKKGWLHRVPGEHDRRQTLVHLTDAGDQYLQGARQTMLDEIGLVLDELGRRDAEEYLRIIGRMTDITLRHQDAAKHYIKEVV